MAKFLKRQVQDLILHDLISDEPSRKLGALQQLCRELEAGKLPVSRGAFTQIVLSLTFYPIPKTRRWAFYAVKLLRIEGAIGQLEYHLLRETDPACRMWAWNTFVALASTNDVKRMIANPQFHYFETPLQLIRLPELVSDTAKSSSHIWQELQTNPVALQSGSDCFWLQRPLTLRGWFGAYGQSFGQGTANPRGYLGSRVRKWSFFNRSDEGTSDDFDSLRHSIWKGAWDTRVGLSLAFKE